MLSIRTTGLENYSAGGTGRVKVLVIGGPGVGKTRWASYFPKPIYLDCEGGLASVADRKVPYATINSSQSMLEALTFLRQESMRPEQERQYRTVVVDTLDAFQRKVKDEWLQAHPNEQSFRGFEAWGYLDTKMQMLLTRLLNLDMNVIVAVHYTDKTITEGTGNDQVQRQEIQLQLSGAVKDQVFNDFDLVGWMGTYYEAVAGERVEKRGLTFKSSFEKPFLKDRLHVTPPWMEVQFSDADYADLFAAVISRLDELEPSEEVGEIPSLVGDGSPAGGVVGPLPGGALPPQDPREVPLEQNDKPTLQKMARELGLEFKGNTLKGELVEMIKAAQAARAAAAPAEETSVEASSDSVTAEAPAGIALTEAERREAAFQRLREVGQTKAAETKAQDAVAAPEPAAEPTVLSAPAEAPPAGFVVDEQGATVNPATGEVIETTMDAAVANVQQELGGEVVLVTETVEAPPTPVPAPAAISTPAPMADGDNCGGVCQEETCTNPIGPNPDYIKLSYIKYRKHLCNDHYLARKAS